MKSEERREMRYQRRKAKREAAKAKRNAEHDFQKVSSFGSLRKSFYVARKGTNWKASVQRYGCNVLRNSYNQSGLLKQHKNVSKGFIEFDLNERGKTRHISSVHISERVVQKSTCMYGITPVISASLINENGASQKGKGTEFASQILIRHLRRHYRKMGFTNSGWIIIGDEHDFFGSQLHSVVNDNMRQLIMDQELVDQTMKFIDAFDKGLGLGSEVCQINAVAYPNRIDHYIKEVLRCKYYGRYMDDWYIIVDTKEEAKRYLDDIIRKYAEIGIQMNPKKTQIIKLSHGFTWLQDRFFLTETGKVVRKPSHKKISRDRRKLKKMANLLERGEMSFEQVTSFYVSFRGYMKWKTARKTKWCMDKLFNSLFIKNFIGGTGNEALVT